MNNKNKPTKTKLKIINTLLNLAKNKPLSDISITELCDSSKTSRMTFYRNYETVDDILNSYLDYIFNEYEENTKLTKSYKDKDNMIMCFKFMYNYKAFVIGLINSNHGTIFYNKLKDFIFNKWSNKTNHIELYVLAGTLYSSFEYWSNSNFSESYEILASKIIKILNWGK